MAAAALARMAAVVVAPRRVRPPLALRAAICGLVLTALGACGFDGPAYAPPPTDGAVVVEMTSSLRFVPEEIKIKVGDTIEWRNRSLQAHTVTTDPVQVRQPRRIGVPEGATVFDSGPVWPGEVWRRTFTVPGTYEYTCVPHERLGMHGTIIVEP
jgi:plastocyanin